MMLPQPTKVFVTGATGLLGNNLVRALLEQGFFVTALTRSLEKAHIQFEDLLNKPELKFVVGDISCVDAFAPAIAGCETVFHTAAFFRDSYKGGNHQKELEQTNVKGCVQLFEAAYAQGVRRFIHTSSIAVLRGELGKEAGESADRNLECDVADDYFRSKVESEQAVRNFMQYHPDAHVTFILPGWMWGPGDMGPTAAGQFLQNVIHRKLPGCMQGSFTVVDARDVAQAHIAAALKPLNFNCNGQRYIVAGRFITLVDLVALIGRRAQVKVPKIVFPTVFVYGLAAILEVYKALTGKPILMSWAAVKLMHMENDRTHFTSAKAQTELGVQFRPLEDSIDDTLNWFKKTGRL